MEMALRLLVCAALLMRGAVVAQAAGGTTASVEVGYMFKQPAYPFDYWSRVHGWLMWISMGFLMPLGIILVRFSKRARENGEFKFVRVLVYVHIFIQVVAVVAVISSAGVGVSKFDNKFHHTHERLGLALWILVWLAPLVGLVRPKHGVRSRVVWYAAHWLFGTGGVILGFINMFIGMHVYELITGKSLRTLNILFAIQVGVMAVVYLTQDRWQYLKDQGTFSKTVAPMYDSQKPSKGVNDEEHQHVPIQIAPSA